MVFEWDQANLEHIARHGVSRFETEAALADPLGLLVDGVVESGEVRYRQVGATVSGRLLVVVFTIRNESIRPITAFDADRPTARSYRQGPRE
jgi:uncharacterized protein